MARKNEKAAADGSTPAPDSGEEGSAAAESAGPADPGAAAPEELAAAEELKEQLQRRNAELVGELEALRSQLEALTQERDAAREIAAQHAKAKERRSERKILPQLSLLSRDSQKSGDLATHAALERVIVALAEVRHAVREGIKSAKGDGQELLEDLEESL